MADREDLLNRALEGELTPEEERELVSMLEADADFRATFLQLLEQDELVAQELDGSRSADAFLEEMRIRLNDRRGSDYVEDVMRKARRRSRPVRVRWGAWTAVAACLVGALGVAVLLSRRQAGPSPSDGRPRIAEASPGAYILRGGERLTCDRGAVLRKSDEIRTGSDGGVTLAYKGEPTTVRVASDARISIPETEGGKQLGLFSGRIDAQVAPQPEMKPFMVSTPNAIAIVRGTEFNLAVREKQTRLDVIEGLVEFRKQVDTGSLNYKVGAGRYAIAGEGVAFAVLPFDEKPILLQELAAAGRPFRDIEYRDGRVLFEDDFSKGIGKWVVKTRSGKKDRERSATEEHRRCVTADRVRDGDGTIPVMSLDARKTGDTWLLARMKEPIPVRRFVVEVRFRCLQDTNRYWSADMGELTAVFVDGTTQIFQKSRKGELRPLMAGKWAVWRRESVAVAAEDGKIDVHIRAYVNGHLYRWGRERSEFDGPWNCGLSVWGARAHVDRVVLKELVPVGEEK